MKLVMVVRLLVPVILFSDSCSGMRTAPSVTVFRALCSLLVALCTSVSVEGAEGIRHTVIKVPAQMCLTALPTLSLLFRKATRGKAFPCKVQQWQCTTRAHFWMAEHSTPPAIETNHLSLSWVWARWLQLTHSPLLRR